jgi:hypothetical protein
MPSLGVAIGLPVISTQASKNQVISLRDALTSPAGRLASSRQVTGRPRRVGM